LRPANANTASRLHYWNDYASGLSAPTSGTNTTFANTTIGSLTAMRRVKFFDEAGAPADLCLAITIAFLAGQNAAGGTCAPRKR
jgi:hypothetical protein